MQIVNKQLSSISTRLVGIASAIGGINQKPPIETIVPEVGGWGTKEFKENSLLNLQIEALGKEIDEKNKALLEKQKKKYPKYDSSIPAIIIENIAIVLAGDSNENKLCQVIFNDLKSMRKLWSWDEVIEKWSADPQNYSPRTIYWAGNRVNQKIAESTDIKEFFDSKLRTIQINPSLLK